MSSSPQTQKTILGQTPTLHLRGVDPNKVAEAYRTGKFTSLQLRAEKLNLDQPIVSTTMVTVGSSPEDETFAFKDKSNIHKTFVTTNHQQYVAVVNESNPPSSRGCDWCRQKIDGEILGVPVKMEMTSYPTGEDLIIFHLDGCCCSFECSLAELKRNRSKTVRYRDALYIDSEQMLQFLYHALYPGQGFLKEAPDYRLLKQHGGPLTTEEFRSRYHTYHRTTNIVTVPIKIIYSKQAR